MNTERTFLYALTTRSKTKYGSKVGESKEDGSGNHDSGGETTERLLLEDVKDVRGEANTGVEHLDRWTADMPQGNGEMLNMFKTVVSAGLLGIALREYHVNNAHGGEKVTRQGGGLRREQA